MAMWSNQHLAGGFMPTNRLTTSRPTEGGGGDPPDPGPSDGLMDFSQAAQSGLMLLLEDI